MGDSLLNVVTGIGTAKDPRTSTRYHLHLLEKNILEHMYRGDWMARRLADLPAHDASREWRTWRMSSKSAQAVKDLENRFFIQRKVYQAPVRSRLYGGGALVIGVDQGHPEEELDLDKVGQGDLKFVIAVSGWLQGDGMAAVDFNPDEPRDEPRPEGGHPRPLRRPPDHLDGGGGSDHQTLGIKAHVRPGIGAWAVGAENSVMTETEGARWRRSKLRGGEAQRLAR
jgi:hypothetical protein